MHTGIFSILLLSLLLFCIDSIVGFPVHTFILQALSGTLTLSWNSDAGRYYYVGIITNSNVTATSQKSRRLI